MIVHDEWKFVGNEYNFNSFHILRFENLYWIKINKVFISIYTNNRKIYSIDKYFFHQFIS